MAAVAWRDDSRSAVRKGTLQAPNRKHRRVPIAAVLRDYLDEHLLSLGWSEGYVFGTDRKSVV